MKTSIGFAPGHSLHREDMAQAGIKYGRGYCVAGGQNKVSCKNTSYTPGISMHRFPKDESLRRLWTQFVRLSTVSLNFFSAQYLDFLIAPLVDQKTDRDHLIRDSLGHYCLKTFETTKRKKGGSARSLRKGERKGVVCRWVLLFVAHPRNVRCHRRADEAGWRDHNDPVCENAGRTWFQDLDVHSWESQEDTRVDFDIALVPDKNLIHDPLRNCNRAQL